MPIKNHICLNVKNETYGYDIFGNGKKYFGYNAEQYNPVTGNQNLRARQVNIRRQRFLTEDTYLGNLKNPITLNRYIYENSNPLKYKDPSGHVVITGTATAIIVISSIVVGLITGVAAGYETGNVETGILTGGATAISIVTGGGAGVAVGGSAAVVSTFGTAGAGVVGAMSSAAVTSASRDALCNAVLGENHSAVEIAEKTTISAGVAGATAIAGYGIGHAFNGGHNSYPQSSIQENANLVQQYSDRMSGSMDNAVINSDVTSCAGGENAGEYSIANNQHNGFIDSFKKIISRGHISGNSRRIISNLDDSSKVVMCFDVGENAHPIPKAGYVKPVDHMNIQVFSDDSNKALIDVHLILDNNMNVVDKYITGK